MAHLKKGKTSILSTSTKQRNKKKKLEKHTYFRSDKNLDSTTEEREDRFSVENAISKSFHKTLHQELEPIWHQLSWKTKNLVSDMKTLKSILVHLTNYDSITFYSFVSALRTTDAAMKSGGWQILDSAETLFCTAKSRVFGPDSGGKDGAKKAKVISFS